MTEHEKLMLRRLLERAKRCYEDMAMDIAHVGDARTASLYASYASDAQLMIDKLNIGLIRVLK